MDEATDPVAGREHSLRLQLAGESAAVTAEQARQGLDAARSDLEAKGYGVGFGFVKGFGEKDDHRLFCFALTDGEREAKIHVLVSETRAGTVAAEGQGLRDWMRDRLYVRAGAIPREQDRYLTLLSEEHPLRVG